MNPALIAPLLLLAAQGDLAKPITLESEPCRMDALLKKLSEKAGVPLATTRQTESDVAVLSMQDVPTQEVMKRLAEISFAEWQKDGDGYRLVRTPKLLRDAEAVDAAARANRIGVALGKLAKEQGATPAWDPKSARQLADRYLARVKAMQSGGGNNDPAFDTAMKQAPLARAMPQILVLLGAAALAEIPPGRRAVFSTAPNRAQRGLPPKAAAVLREMVRQQAQFSEEYRKVKPRDDREYYFSSSNPDIRGKPELGPGKSLLVVNSNNGYLALQLLVADPEGTTMMDSQYSLSYPLEDVPADSTSSKVELPAETVALGKAVVDSGYGWGSRNNGSVKMMSISPEGPLSFETTSSSVGGTNVSGSLREKVLRPDQYEPLALMAGPVIAALSKTKNVIGILPDALLPTLASQVASPQRTEASLRKTLERGETPITSAGEWTTIKPNYPALSIERRANRAALTRILGRMSSEGYLGLIDVCNYALAQSSPVTSGNMEACYMGLINSGLASRAAEMLEFPAILRIYGTLSDSQRSTLASGKTITLATLTTQQRDWLTNEVYSTWNGMSVGSRSYQYNYDISVANERTELLPNGLTLDSAIRLEVEEEPALYAFANGADTGSIVTAANLASHRYQLERSDLANVGTPPTYDRFQPAKQAVYSFNVDLAGKVQFGRMAYDTWVDRKASIVGYDGLPQSLRDAADKTLDRFRRSFGHMQDGKLIPPF